MMVDCHVHVRAFSARRAQLFRNNSLNVLMDKALDKLNNPSINQIYNGYMNLVNLRDNRFMPKVHNTWTDAAQKLAFTSNLPFYSSKNEESNQRFKTLN